MRAITIVCLKMADRTKRPYCIGSHSLRKYPCYSTAPEKCEMCGAVLYGKSKGFGYPVRTGAARILPTVLGTAICNASAVGKMSEVK